jgi:hypothetical protein
MCRVYVKQSISLDRLPVCKGVVSKWCGFGFGMGSLALGQSNGPLSFGNLHQFGGAGRDCGKPREIDRLHVSTRPPRATDIILISSICL